MEQKSTVIFINNSAENEGAIFHSNVTFDSNTAGQSGGAIHFDEHTNAAFKNSTNLTRKSLLHYKVK